MLFMSIIATMIAGALALLGGLWSKEYKYKCKRNRTTATSAVPSERRGAPRMPIRVDAELQPETGEVVRGETRDLSLTGLFLVTRRPLEPESECRITLLLGDDRRIRLKLRGRVAHTVPGGMGVAFTAMNQECFENLRYLIDYNSHIVPPSLNHNQVA